MGTPEERGEVHRKTGVAIVSPYGGIWTDQVFDDVSKAKTYLRTNYAYDDRSKFRYAMAVQTIELFRAPGEVQFVDGVDQQTGKE